MRQEVAFAGAGVSPDAGGVDHVRIWIGAEALSRLLAPAIAPVYLDESATQFTVQLPEGEGEATLTAQLRPRLTDVSAVSGDAGPELVLGMDVVLRVRIDGRGADQSYTTTGRGTTRAALRLVQVGSESALSFLVDRPTVGSIEIPGDVMPEPIRDALDPWGPPLFREALLSLDDVEVTLASFAPLPTSLQGAALTPSMLEVDVETGAIRCGFVTSLRPRGVPPAAVPLPVMSDEIRVELHPGLPEAALRAALASGEARRRYTGRGAVDPLGDFAVTLDELSLATGADRLRFVVWCVDRAPCGRVGLELPVFVTPAIDGPEVTLGALRTEGEPPLGFVTTDWGEGGFVTLASELTRALMQAVPVRPEEDATLSVTSRRYDWTASGLAQVVRFEVVDETPR